MELFFNTRLKIGKSLLTKKISRIKRKIHFSNFSQVKNIGIVWDASNPNDFVIISKFHQRMQERNIQVKVLGYFPGKELPNQYTAIRYLTCLRKNELNIFYLPVSSDVASFINSRFEILIDTNFRNLFPLNYISSLSDASFKVGLFEEGNKDSPFDMMMDIKNPVAVEHYLNEVIHYLEMINAKENAKID